MDYSELKALIRELQKIDERFRIGLTVFIEGVQAFHGNLRLLLDVYLFQDCTQQLCELIQRRGLRWGFCVRDEATFIVISSK